MKRWVSIARGGLILGLVAGGGGLAASTAADPGPLRVITAGRERYVTLRDFASAYGFSLHGPSNRIIELGSQWTRIRFETNSRQVRYNGLLLWLHAPVVTVQKHWAITEADARKVLEPLLRKNALLRPQRARVVVLDPGHGGQDRGARGKRGVEEKGIVLDIAKRARTHLANAGLKVYLTRDTDRFIELEDRAARAAAWGADLFVSIHLNAAAASSARGIETYVLAVPGYPPTAAAAGSKLERLVFPGNRNDSINTILGYYLHKALMDKIGGTDRGLRRARFVVLKRSTRPAVLVECGFLSNGTEESLMLNALHREALALAIAKGILDYASAIRAAQAAP
ncbi:MAG: N-acetylmuramoyl-L-alanine amidase [Verrucomicrobia bacterium]|nr:N-acetylmuramoyl-L-alanine amidase [Verrucomicrobiota bacterium]MBU1910536.1 N-acetylmuramoyl-L-alanine amidase [Verrucomicrobiota bacterium]